MDDRIAAHLRESDRRGLEPVVTAAVKIENAVTLLSDDWPDIAEAVEKATVEAFVCISEFGASFGLSPIPA